MDASSTIRPARHDDVPGMLAIYEPIVRNTAVSFELEPPTVEQLADRLQSISEHDPWLVSERDGQIAGYAYASAFRGRDAYRATRETTVYVGAEHQRRGVGRQLMTGLLSQLTARGARVAIAVVALPNPASVALHEALGFRHAGTLHEVGYKFGRWHDEGFWELPLAFGTAGSQPLTRNREARCA